MSLLSGSNSAFSSSSFFLLVLVIQVQALLSGGLQLLAVELLQLLNRVLIDGIHHVQHLDTLLPQGLQERRGRNRLNALAGDVEDVVLTLSTMY